MQPVLKLKEECSLIEDIGAFARRCSGLLTGNILSSLCVFAGGMHMLAHRRCDICKYIHPVLQSQNVLYFPSLHQSH